MTAALRCAMCNRPLNAAAVSIASRRGLLAFGRVCARRSGLTLRAARKARQTAVRAKRQAVLFDSRQMAFELEVPA
jgi:hypothetical protein